MRILPPYYAAMTLSLVLIATVIGDKTGTHWDFSIPVTTSSIATHTLLIHDLGGERYTINHVLWSIPVECRTYIAFPLLVVFWRAVGPLSPVIASAVFVYASKVLFWSFDGYCSNAHYLVLFAAGMLGADIAFGSSGTLSWLRRLQWGAITLLMMLGVVLMSICTNWEHDDASIYKSDCAIGACSLATLVHLGRADGHFVKSVISSRFLVYIGKFSYSIYLIHAPLLQVLSQYAFASLKQKPLAMLMALTVLGIPIIIVLSYAFACAFEFPFVGSRKSSQVRSNSASGISPET